MYQYKNLQGLPFHKISACLNCAFSDYAFPIHLDEKALAELLSATGVDRSLSFGAFLNGTLIGFMFNSCGLYQGHRAAFDVATGVIPAHRGKQVFTCLFAFAKRALRQQQIERYYLEVLQENERAIALYKRQGFSITREFAVLSASTPKGYSPSRQVQFSRLAAFDFQQAAGLNRNLPSYEHSDRVLWLHPDRYEVAFIKGQTISAWCVFSKENGQIFQFGWNGIKDLREVVLALLLRYPHVAAKNIESNQQQILEMLESLSFKVITRQYEMVHTLDYA